MIDKDDLSIKQPTKIDKPSNKERKLLSLLGL